MRVSDDERDATIRVLRDGHADGRIGPATLEERVGRALTAKRADDLRELTVDIKRVSRMRAWFAHLVGDRESGAEEGVARIQEPSLWLSGLGHRTLVVGRAEQADVVVIDETVSRLHAQIVRSPDGYILTDLASTNGTWLDGRRVGQIEVVPGDVVLLGQLPLHLL
ncbi:MAG: FHA domain-containing protein [Actinomycetota bacterium]|nr:FHA domain-containing protein [Actinomycetota bacterium]